MNKLKLDEIRTNGMIIKIIIFLFVIAVFAQNFLFSNSFSIISLRNIDDFAFQISLNKYINNLSNNITFMNDYGYGWIYWFPLVILNIPGWLLFKHFDISWLLIVAPRMQSLMFSIGCIFLMYKIVSRYTENEWLKMVIVFFLPLFPTGGYLAGRFGTVNQVAFFSMLSCYFILQYETDKKKYLTYSVISFSFALATKVSAIVVAPIIVLIILERSNWKISLKDLLFYIKHFFLAVLLTIFLMSPALFLYPINKEKGKLSIGLLKSYWLANANMADVVGNIKEIIRFSSFPVINIILIIFGIIFCICGIKKDKKKYNDIRWLYIGFFIGMMYLVISINTGVYYIFSYATAISFVLPFGLLVFDRQPKAIIHKYIIKVICVLLLCIQLYHILFISDSVNVFNYTKQYRESYDDIDVILELQEIVESANLDVVRIFGDHTALLGFYNEIEHDDVAYAVTIWDNLGEADYEGVNVILLDKNSCGFLSDEKFDEFIGNMDEEQKKMYIMDRKCREILVSDHTFNNAKYDLKYEDDKYYMFILE